jgi:YidC/Oxa1 family membrane protein insertase
MADILYAIIIFPIAQILEFTFLLSQKLFRESGISVIFISIAISVLCLPLYAVAERWQQLERDTQKKLKSKIDKIKKVFSGDEQYMILSAYYRQNNYHPVFALRSTFGLLIQIPFFIAAFSFLSHLEIIKNVPFLFIRDLGAPDALFSIGGLTVNLLPIAMTAINCLAGAIYVKGLPPRDKIQLYGMALIFLLLLYNSPSALVLYWTMNNVFSLFKNIYYRVQNKYKFHVLLGLFSFACIFIAVFCLLIYGYKPNAQKLALVSFFAAIVPWPYIMFKDRLSSLIKTKYETSKSFAVFLLSISVIWALFGLFIPSQLVVSSPQEFSFVDNFTNPLFFIFNASFQILGLFVFWPFCLYFLFSDNVKKYFSIFFLAACIGMIVNVFLFSGNYGLISISFVYDISPGHSGNEILLNLCIMLFLFVASCLLYRLRNKKIIIAILSFCGFSLLSISVVNLFKINSAFGELKTYYVKEQKDIKEVSPLFSLSKNGKNIVVIMLDRAVSGFMPLIFDESPRLKETYSGFTFYPNTVSFNGYTKIGAPPVYGGYEYTPEDINKRINVPLVEKHNQSLLMLPRILNENGFSVCVTDPPYANYNWKSDISIFDDYPGINAYITDSQYTDFWLNENGIKLPETSDIIKRNMFWYSVHKGLPLLFRQPVYMFGNWCSTIPNNSLRLTLNGYAVLDYLPRLTGIIGDNVNTALIMTNNTTHEGSLLQAPEYVPSITITDYGKTRFAQEAAYHINAAAINRLAKWFDFLKKENMYDNTRIILVSDHGPESNFIIKSELPVNVDQFNPLLMVKDFDSSGELKTDMTFMSNADVPYLALNGMIDNPKNPFTGSEISTKRKEKPLYIAVSGSIHIDSDDTSQFRLNPKRDYYVHDSIFDSKNWIPANQYE